MLFFACCKLSSNRCILSLKNRVMEKLSKYRTFESLKSEMLPKNELSSKVAFMEFEAFIKELRDIRDIQNPKNHEV